MYIRDCLWYEKNVIEKSLNIINEHDDLKQCIKNPICLQIKKFLNK